MFSYPTKQTPDPNASPDDHGVPIEEPVGAKVMASAIAESKAKDAKIAAVEKVEEDKVAAEAKEEEKLSAKVGKAMSLAQTAPVDLEGYSDPAHQPHAILPNSVHKDSL